MTNKCLKCKYATYDYETYFNTCQKQWFIDGCQKNCDPKDCEGFEEVDND